MNADWQSAYWRDLQGSDLVHNGHFHCRSTRSASAEMIKIRRHFRKLKARDERQMRMIIRLHRVGI